jgi:hypothetical protein
MVDFSNFFIIMTFYSCLSYIIFPIIFYYSFGKTIEAVGNGFVTGSVATILLWYFAGKNMALKR